MAHFDEREWASAWGSIYPGDTPSMAGEGRRRRRWPTRRPPFGSALIAGAILAGLVATGAVAASGDPLREAVRNGTTSAETEIVGDVDESTAAKGGYVTRQSNVSTGDDAGGAAIYGCRAPTASSETCLRAANLSSGPALSLDTAGPVAADIRVGNPAGVPFTTNATGLVANLNADKVDGLDASQLAGAPGPKGDKGDKGDTGATGATGATGPPGISGYEVVANDVVVPSGGTARDTALCPIGKRVLGGGAGVIGAGGGFHDVDIHESSPGQVGSPERDLWLASVRNNEGAARTVRIEAICANVAG